MYNSEMDSKVFYGVLASNSRETDRQSKVGQDMWRKLPRANSHLQTSSGTCICTEYRPLGGHLRR